METKIGLYLKNYRKKNKISQETFAFNIGITTRHYQKIESGKISVTISTLGKILDAMGISFVEFFINVCDFNDAFVA